MRVKGDEQEVRDLANLIKDTLQQMIHLDSDMSKAAKSLESCARDGSGEILEEQANKVGKQLEIALEPCFAVYKSLMQYADYLSRL